MAIGVTMHTFDIQLADVDRSVYEDLSVRVARHPSETDAFMLTRVLAYALEYEEGIAFSEGISATDEPAVVVRDLTGALVAWIEVGSPDAARLHTGSLAGARVAVYTQRDPAKVAAGWAGKKIHRSDEVKLYSFDHGFFDSATSALERRNTMIVSVTERRIYLDLNGSSFESDIHEVTAG
ncbi:YaeQ family protein [Microbacterium trichothecenolyticum]